MLAVQGRYIIEPGLARGYWLIDTFASTRPLPTVPIRDYKPNADRRSHWFVSRAAADAAKRILGA